MNPTTKRKPGKPVEPLTVVPVGVSKLNCEAVYGITERQLYELGRAHKLPRLPGKIPVYRADALTALFSSDEQPSSTEADDEPASAADVLARIGRRGTGGR